MLHDNQVAYVLRHPSVDMCILNCRESVLWSQYLKASLVSDCYQTQKGSTLVWHIQYLTTTPSFKKHKPTQHLFFSAKRCRVWIIKGMWKVCLQMPHSLSTAWWEIRIRKAKKWALNSTDFLMKARKIGEEVNVCLLTEGYVTYVGSGWEDFFFFQDIWSFELFFSLYIMISGHRYSLVLPWLTCFVFVESCKNQHVICHKKQNTS